jgi:hypothetical protein
VMSPVAERCAARNRMMARATAMITCAVGDWAACADMNFRWERNTCAAVSANRLFS